VPEPPAKIIPFIHPPSRLPNSAPGLRGPNFSLLANLKAKARFVYQLNVTLKQ
jgi:hypothetical protein